MSVRTRRQTQSVASAAAMHLPQELWNRIVGYATDLDSLSRPDFDEDLLPPFSPESLRAKLHISMLSRSFRRISLPYLYEAIVVESREALTALEHTLVDRPAAEDLSSHVRMLRFEVTEDMIDVCDGRSDTVKRILNNTRNLKAFHCPLQISDELEFFAPCLPSSVETIAWYARCYSQASRDAICNAISSCTRSLRALSVASSSDIRQLATSESFRCDRLVNLDLALFEGQDEIFRDFLKLTAITHVVTMGIYLDCTQEDISYTRITHISVTRLIILKLGDLKPTFPDLQILSFPTPGTAEWLQGLHHSSLHTIILDNRDIDIFTESDIAWSFLQEHISAISIERFPNLRSVTLKFQDDVFCRGFWDANKAMVDTRTAKLRDAGILVDIE